ncbi:MAG: peptidylprolyl isomerase [Gallionella sp.]
MLKRWNLSTLALLGTIFATSVWADENTVATVNGVAIPQARADLMVKMATAQGQADSPQLREAVRDELINIELLVQEARKSKLDKNPDIIQQVEHAQLSVLGGAYLKKYAKENQVTEERLSKEYDQIKASPAPSEYEVSHILVADEDTAKSIISELDKKGKFEEIAKEKSQDAGSAARSGSLGWTSPQNLVPSFASAMVNLKKGQISKEPVQSKFGWHVIRLDNVRDVTIPGFAELKPKILQRIQQMMLQELFAELRSKAKIE